MMVQDSDLAPLLAAHLRGDISTEAYQLLAEDEWRRQRGDSDARAVIEVRRAMCQRVPAERS